MGTTTQQSSILCKWHVYVLWPRGVGGGNNYTTELHSLQVACVCVVAPRGGGWEQLHNRAPFFASGMCMCCGPEGWGVGTTTQQSSILCKWHVYVLWPRGVGGGNNYMYVLLSLGISVN